MAGMESVAAAMAVATHELVLFAAVGIALGGLDDLLVDLVWIVRSAARRLTVYRRHPRCTADTLPPPDAPGRLAVFVAAWREAEVIGAMLRATLSRYDHADYRIYVGVYPNDPGTRRAVQAVADEDDRVRMVGGLLPGPTTKAECLNRLWRQLAIDEAVERRPFKAIVIHDAEDVVHPAELKVFDRLVERFALVQLPVLPLIDQGPVSATYGDEFAVAHSVSLVVREALGAGLPSAGVGCAIARPAMLRMAAKGRGRPFDEGSLTEDYEMGLRLRQVGGRGAFVVMPATSGGPPVATRAYFPNTIDASVRQKTRWLTGIALAGWDRLGWGAGGAEIWMRLRDRRAIAAALVLAAAYAGALLAMLCGLLGLPLVVEPWLGDLLVVNGAVLGWRLAMRCWIVSRLYGLRQGLHSIWRVLLANLIAVAAARRAVTGYAMVREGPPRWDKTSHHYPTELPCG